MSKENWDVIRVLLKGGKRIRVIAECVIGEFAVHRRIYAGHPVDDGFTVTYVPSGMSVYTTLQESEARLVAKALDDMQANPVTGPIMFSRPEFPKTLERLAAVAPRYVPHVLL